jgi:hypothetical protein
MLHRPDGDAIIAITQPAHAWVSGQLARAWGNARFGGFEPYEEVCLAADQHDLAWAEWEMAPTLNPETGLPHAFTELPTARHTALLARGPALVGTQCRYAGLLTALHAVSLYELRDYTGNDPNTRLAREFLAGQRSWAGREARALAAMPAYARAAAAPALPRNQRLLRCWDRVSLLLCHGLQGESRVPGVPAAPEEAVELVLTPDRQGTIVEPWPFRDDRVELTWEGRRLEGRYRDEQNMREALAGAPPILTRLTLVRGA